VGNTIDKFPVLPEGFGELNNIHVIIIAPETGISIKTSSTRAENDLNKGNTDIVRDIISV
jgi:hypothetical protein